MDGWKEKKKRMRIDHPTVGLIYSEVE